MLSTLFSERDYGSSVVFTCIDKSVLNYASRDGCVYLITGKYSFIPQRKTDSTTTKTDSVFMHIIPVCRLKTPVDFVFT